MTRGVKLPPRYWSGRVAATKILRDYVNYHCKWGYVTQDQATDIAEEMLQAFLMETQRKN